MVSVQFILAIGVLNSFLKLSINRICKRAHKVKKVEKNNNYTKKRRTKIILHSSFNSSLYSGCQTRTDDNLINSQVLYQLS